MENLYVYLASIPLVLALLAISLGVLLIMKKRRERKKRDGSNGENGGTEHKKGDGALGKLIGKLRPGTQVFWNLAIIVAGGILFYYYLGLESKATPTEVGGRVWNHWQQILALWAIAAILIKLNSDEKNGKLLQKVVMYIVVVTLIGLPIWSWLTVERPASAPTKTAACVKGFTNDLFTTHPAYAPDGGYSARTKWVPMTIPPGTDSCLVETPRGGHVEWDADRPSIHDLEVRCVYKDSGATGSVRTDGCKTGPVYAGYVHNPTSAPATVWFAYAKG